MHPVVIVAGGYGTRIKKFSKGNPKILLNIDGNPFIYYLLNYLQTHGVKKVIICSGFGHLKIKKYIDKNKYKFNKLKIKISYEGKKRLGTAGSIRSAIKLLKDNFIIIYGDNLFNFNFKKLLKMKIKKNKSGLMIIKKNDSNYIKSNVIRNKKSFFYKKKSKGNGQYYDYGILIFIKKVFKNLIKFKKYDLSDICENLSKKNEIDFIITKKKLIEIGSIRGYQVFQKKIYEFYKEISN